MKTPKKIKPIIAEDYLWYEVFAIKKDGSKDFVYRTIATSKSHAVEKADQENLKIMGSKTLGGMAFNRYIKTLEADVVSDFTLSCLDLNNATHVEMLRTTHVIPSRVVEHDIYRKDGSCGTWVATSLEK